MKIVINADDFGWSSSCTEAILQCFEKEYITTATMCANGEAFEEAVQRVKETPYKDCVGIHFVLTEGFPLTEEIRRNPLLCDENGMFHGRVPRNRPLDGKTQQQVLEELQAQAKKFVETGLLIHHMDSHHHVHTGLFISPLVRKVAGAFGVDKQRIHRNVGAISLAKRLVKYIYNEVYKKWAYTDYFGSFEDVALCPEILAQKGSLEIMCHPDLDRDGILVDRKGADYENPAGIPMKDQIAVLCKKEDHYDV